MYKHRRLIVSIIAGLLVLTMVVGLISSLAYSASAASSSEIKSQINDLENQASEIAQKKKDLQAQISENQAQTQSAVEKKTDLDQQIEVTQEEIQNQTAQIQEYNQMIAEKQAELDDALNRQAELMEQYQMRLRYMEENGNVSYWSVLFRASSFSDLLDQIDMIQEVAKSDQLMMDQLEAVADEIETTRSDLEEQRTTLEARKEELSASESTLQSQREECDGLITELQANQEEYEALELEYAEQEEALSNQIAQKENEYDRAKVAEQAALHAQQNSGGGYSGGGNSTNAPAASGFLYPLPAGSASVTCAYGYRIHPITGQHSFHNGVDLGAAGGTPIYATKSGTVTTATYSSVYGYYVVINHGDGFSSLYGHMTNYVVSAGTYVEQGQVIGYVGTTGWSTGNHLHFTIYYNGSTVNPMSYV